MYDNNQVVNSALTMGMKIGGEIAKTILLTVLKKVKETKENKVGLTTLKNLLKSKDELGVIKINKDNLREFKKKANRLGVTFASISSPDSDEVKIMYKTIQTNQVKECLMEMLEHEQSNKLDEIQERSVYDSMNKNMDFPGVYDGLYRYAVDNTTNEKSVLLSDLLKEKGIRNDIAVIAINEDNTFKVNFIVDENNKDKAMEILDNNKEKTVEELTEMLRPRIINADEVGLGKYGVEVNKNEYEDKYGNIKETFSMSLGDKVVNHAIEDKHYSTISDTLKRLYFSKEQINELKKEDPFVKERAEKEEYYENVLNKSNKGKEPLDDLILKAEKQKKTKSDIKDIKRSKEVTKEVIR